LGLFSGIQKVAPISVKQVSNIEQLKR